MQKEVRDFIVTPEYNGYIFVGCAYGRFDAQDAGGTLKKDYANMYVLSPVSDYTSDDYHAAGFKAEKKRCISPDVWKDLQIGERVRLFFDDKKRVVMVTSEE